jgi:hypothetical protein
MVAGETSSLLWGGRDRRAVVVRGTCGTGTGVGNEWRWCRRASNGGARGVMRTSLLQVQSKETRRTSVGVHLIHIMVEVGLHLGFQEQSWVKSTPRALTDSVLDDPRM